MSAPITCSPAPRYRPPDCLCGRRRPGPYQSGEDTTKHAATHVVTWGGRSVAVCGREVGRALCRAYVECDASAVLSVGIGPWLEARTV